MVTRIGINGFGRIAAVADVFDALTTKRPWREAMSVDEAVKTMQSELGSALDPELLGHFLDSLDEVVGIMQRFADRSVD